MNRKKRGLLLEGFDLGMLNFGLDHWIWAMGFMLLITHVWYYLFLDRHTACATATS